MNNNFKIWYHPYFGFTSIHAMIQEYSDIMINEYDKSKVDINEINIIPFFWENGNQIGIPFIINTDKFIEILKELNDLNFFVFADFSTEVYQGTDNKALENLKKIILPNINFKRFFLVQNDSTTTSLEKLQYGDIILNTMYIPYFTLSTPL
jgi:hypothetical protein